MEARSIVEQARWEEEVRILDCKRMMGHEFHVPQRQASPERHVHAQADDPVSKGTLEAFIRNDESFALQANDSAVDHVKRNEAVNGLIGVNKRERKLVAPTNHTVPHALFFSDVLESGCRCASSIGGTWLCMAGGFANHWQALLVSAEIKSATLQQINVFDRSCRGFGHDVLVAEERPVSNRVFTVTSVVHLLNRS